ncbi:MAG TPA: entericidin A/B family lipoprotein [Phycisphaerales bacterium]|nr:entericidin A/B family lipoprotein [Phycisphaerales bacterium]
MKTRSLRLLLTLLALPLIAAAILAVPACNTVEGAGEDIESAGEGISDTSRDVRD